MNPGNPPRQIALRWHFAALLIIAIGTGILFLDEPGFGDDLTYWSFAFNLHEQGLDAWNRNSFHNLRWPVWGGCWLLQTLGFPGLVSFYGVPCLYLALGTTLAFVFGKRVAGSLPAAWACGLAYLFHPLLDTVCNRPMPDLSEGVWGGVVLLGWWATMEARTRSRAVLFAALSGAALFVLEANRITGVLLIPLLVLATLLFYPRRFGWIVALGLFSAIYYAAQAGFYRWHFGDWLHDIHANLGNKGAKGTEFENVWFLPFRFFDTLWASSLIRIYLFLSAFGCWAAWRQKSVAGRLMVVWFVGLFLEFSCAPQSLSPFRPLIRDADRFLASLAIPMSVLAAFGLFTLFQPAWLGRWPAAAWLARRPIVAGLLGFALLATLTTREFFDLGFVPEMRRYMASLPDGTRVFSHKAMRETAALVDQRQMRRFRWFAPNEIIHRTDALEAAATQSDEFWYVRKLVWLTSRKALEKKQRAIQPTLGSYFAAPDAEWRLSAVLTEENVPDLIFFRRRTAALGAPGTALGPTADAWRDLVPPLPATWTRGRDPSGPTVKWTIPAEFKNQLVRLDFDAAAEEVEAVAIRVRFFAPGREKFVSESLLKPYFYPQNTRNFFAVHVPPDADHCTVQLRFSKRARQMTFQDFRIVVEGPPLVAQ